MREQKVSQSDPEFMKVHRFLSAVQQQSNFRKAQQQQQQQMQQAQANGASNGAVRTGSTAAASAAPTQNAATAPSTNGSTVAAADQLPANIPASQQQSAATVQRVVTAANGTFTPEQLNTLRTQIYAFKMLSKNMSLPLKLQQQLFPPLKDAPDIAVATNPTDGTKQPSAAEDVITKASFEKYQSPYDLLAAPISFSDHSQRSKRHRIPALMPPGVDVEQVREDREKIIYNRVQSRKAELAALPANIGSWDSATSNRPTSDDSLKLKALIEFKMLSLLQKQRDFRREIQQELFQYDNLAMTANRAHHRRMKKQSLREARFTEKLEKQQRDARENKEKTKQQNYLQSIVQHGVDVKNSALAQRNRIQKMGRIMVNHHGHMEREEQKRIERTAKQRLQALKANDEETYLKLLGQAKDSRISHLLKQTDGFLTQLAASVRAAQRGTAERYGDDEIEELEEEGEGSEDEEGGRKVDLLRCRPSRKRRSQRATTNASGRYAERISSERLTVDDIAVQQQSQWDSRRRDGLGQDDSDHKLAYIPYRTKAPEWAILGNCAPKYTHELEHGIRQVGTKRQENCL